MAGRSHRARKKRAAYRKPAHAGSFGEWLQFFGVSTTDPYWREPYWPPDVYAITAAFLRRTGTYVKFLNHGRPAGDSESEALGKKWRATLSDGFDRYWRGEVVSLGLPMKVASWWQKFAGCKGSFGDAAEDLEMQEAAWNLCIVSDVASRGIGVRTMKLDDSGHDPFLATALAVLVENQRLSFCLKIPSDKLAVLAKQHTPQRGCTIRSLTHHLAYYVPAEIKAYWAEPWEHAEGLEVLNLLLLPWPTTVQAHDFGTAPHPTFPTGYALFDYRPQASTTPSEMVARVKRALKAAEKLASRIHGIVLPELALTRQEFSAVERLAIRKRALLIAGVRDENDRGVPTNSCVIQPYGLTAAYSGTPNRQDYMQTRRIQFKHHQWCLDRGQILQYGLGARLSATRLHWEHMTLEPREISFVTLEPWLTICALICEDLARQEPIGEVVRAVGPNLVFALLMDGPQLKHRWPSRYASVLAEDPGCSVLTLTSMGMAARSRMMEPGAADRSLTVGLWRDQQYGERELTLDKGHDACVLSLARRTETEYTLDGRHDEGQAHFPVFAGFRSFDVQS